METIEKAKALWAAVKGDGCTRVPDWHSAYKECCNRHDADYSTHTDEQGNALTRKQSDKRLFDCMKRNSKTFLGKFFVSTLYFVGVRVFGKSYWAKTEEGNGNASY